jgi:hypothetical protein
MADLVVLVVATAAAAAVADTLAAALADGQVLDVVAAEVHIILETIKLILQV